MFPVSSDPLFGKQPHPGTRAQPQNSIGYISKIQVKLQVIPSRSITVSEIKKREKQRKRKKTVIDDATFAYKLHPLNKYLSSLDSVSPLLCPCWLQLHFVNLPNLFTTSTANSRHGNRVIYSAVLQLYTSISRV